MFCCTDEILLNGQLQEDLRERVPRHYIYLGGLSVPVWIRSFFLDRITLAISNEIIGEHTELHRCP